MNDSKFEVFRTCKSIQNKQDLRKIFNNHYQISKIFSSFQESVLHNKHYKTFRSLSTVRHCS